ncbi:bifunctional UDP-sugar hydrolase/5'-nucleotidase UshA [Mesocricetibacter intestinalis]|nr:bifunctional UDP-sugar hydrolase/5'-nucleotidase UshA [Mesocricetibacter intestinalis]
MRIKTALKFGFAACALLYLTPAMSYQPDKTYRFTLLHTNDLHGRFAANERGEYGLAAHKTLVDRIRKEVEGKGGAVLVLNAGDVNTGVPESDLQNARPDIEAMNAIGYDAMALGNHEFDNPLQLLEMQEKWAKFPFLSANVYLRESDRHLVKPYTVLDKNGLSIAVIGLTTEDTAKLGNPEYTGAVHFADPTKAAKQAIEQLSKRQPAPDIIIALTHMGYYFNAEHGSNAPGDVTLARNLAQSSLPRKLDIIVGGHSHDTVCIDESGQFISDYQPTQPCRPDKQGDSWIMQAGEWGKYLGRADFEFKNNRLELVHYELIPVNLKQKIKTPNGSSEYRSYAETIPQDEEVAALLKPYQEEGHRLLGGKIGRLRGDLIGDTHIVRFQQTNLGRLIAEAQRQRVKADIGIMNSGGIRAGINAGEVSYRDILQVQPFGNQLSYVELKGQALLDFLTEAALKQTDSGAYAQFAGVSMQIDRRAGTIDQLRIQGEAFDPNRIYRISMPSYIAAGGDGYPLLSGHPSYVNSGFVDAEVLKAFFQQNSPINAEAFNPGQDIRYR